MVRNMNKAVNIIWFLGIISIFTVHKGYIYLSYFWLLLFLIYLHFNFKTKQGFNFIHPAKTWILILAASVILGIIPRFLLSENTEYYKNLKYILFYSLAVILFLKFKPSIKTYFYALITAVLIFLAVIAYFKFFYHTPNIEINTIYTTFPFHTLASDILILWASLITACGIYFYKNKQFPLFALAIIVAMLAVLAAVLSGGRGSLLLIPPAIIILVLYFNKQNFIKNLSLAFIIVFSALTILYFVPQTNFKHRVTDFIADFSKYSQGNVSTSQGLRIEVYKCALNLATKSPIYGLGDTIKVLENYSSADTKICNNKLNNFPHFHNDLIEQYMHYGILGLLSLALILFFPALYALLRLLRSKNLNEFEVFCCYSMLLLSLAYFMFGLSDKFILYRSNLIFYLILQAFFITGITKTYGKQ